MTDCLAMILKVNIFQEKDIESANSSISESFLDHLRQMRYPENQVKSTRKRKLNVPLGKSISPEDVTETDVAAGPSVTHNSQIKDVENNKVYPDPEISAPK